MGRGGVLGIAPPSPSPQAESPEGAGVSDSERGGKPRLEQEDLREGLEAGGGGTATQGWEVIDAFGALAGGSSSRCWGAARAMLEWRMFMRASLSIIAYA